MDEWDVQRLNGGVEMDSGILANPPQRRRTFGNSKGNFKGGRAGRGPKGGAQTASPTTRTQQQSQQQQPQVPAAHPQGPQGTHLQQQPLQQHAAPKGPGGQQQQPKAHGGGPPQDHWLSMDLEGRGVEEQEDGDSGAMCSGGNGTEASEASEASSVPARRTAAHGRTFRTHRLLDWWA